MTSQDARLHIRCQSVNQVSDATAYRQQNSPIVTNHIVKVDERCVREPARLKIHVYLQSVSINEVQRGRKACRP
jgi:hypothetical protein